MYCKYEFKKTFTFFRVVVTCLKFDSNECYAYFFCKFVLIVITLRTSLKIRWSYLISDYQFVRNFENYFITWNIRGFRIEKK